MTSALTTESRQEQRVPYLAPVPDSLPPFDDHASVRPDSSGPARARLTLAATGTGPGAAVRPAPSRTRPVVDRAAHAMARALLEVLALTRPLAQLRAHCSPEVQAVLRPPQRAIPHRLLRVHTGNPTQGVAEVCVVFRTPGRVHVAAFRMDDRDGRWVITALQLG